MAGKNMIGICVVTAIEDGEVRIRRTRAPFFEGKIVMANINKPVVVGDYVQDLHADSPNTVDDIQWKKVAGPAKE